MFVYCRSVNRKYMLFRKGLLWLSAFTQIGRITEKHVSVGKECNAFPEKLTILGYQDKAYGICVTFYKKLSTV